MSTKQGYLLLDKYADALYNSHVQMPIVDKLQFVEGANTVSESRSSPTFAEIQSFSFHRELLPDGIANTIRQAIISGDLHPGQRLMEVELAERFGVSRAPLREALRQLVAEGLLVNLPHRGTYVRELTEEDIREIYSLRGVLEALAVKILIDTLTPDHVATLTSIIEEIKEAIKRRDTMAIVDLDMRFHETICRLSGHSRVYEDWVRMESQLRSFFAAADRLYTDNQLIERHQELVDALVSGNKAKAAEVVEEHISNAVDRLLRDMHGRMSSEGKRKEDS
jgi:DNA-binding GntR family transcriptional regulator